MAFVKLRHNVWVTFQADPIRSESPANERVSSKPTALRNITNVVQKHPKKQFVIEFLVDSRIIFFMMLAIHELIFGILWRLWSVHSLDGLRSTWNIKFEILAFYETRIS